MLSLPLNNVGYFEIYVIYLGNSQKNLIEKISVEEYMLNKWMQK